MSDTADTLIIGAGVVGLAVARRLAQDGREVIVAEAAPKFGTETSSRNSEVIHAGIYYPKDSLKARFCIEGKTLLYAYCRERGIPHLRCGKIIVATDEGQLPILEKLKQAGEANGVHDLRLIDADEAGRIEPNVSCVKALVSPSTGIVDSHSLMESFKSDCESLGGMVVFNTRACGGTVTAGALHMRLREASGTEFELRCKSVVNCGGLHAQDVARSIAGVPASSIPTRYLSKGSYFTLSGKSPFRGLVYPVPEVGALGIHSILDLGGGTRFGPDQEIVSAIDYDVTPSRGDVFYAAIRKYYPALPDGSLSPGFAGIRSKLHPPGTPAADFRVQGPDEHGVPGLVNLYGIESPGLTSAMAIAARVSALLERNG